MIECVSDSSSLPGDEEVLRVVSSQVTEAPENGTTS